MTLEFLAILAVVATFSVVQSIFGMGVLVFGTPTLLLMGYDFPTTLSILLPASFSISLLQVLTAGASKVRVSRFLYLLCLPGIGFGLWLTDNSLLIPWINTLVGGTMLISALVRIWPPSLKVLTALLNKHLAAYHLIMGVIHGLTNLGGAMLAILASGTNTEKAAIRYTVAHYYLAFSVIQMLLLATLMGHADRLIANVSTAAVSALVYFLVGNRIFIRSSNHAYNTALTMFIAIYGAAILLTR